MNIWMLDLLGVIISRSQFLFIALFADVCVDLQFYKNISFSFPSDDMIMYYVELIT